MYSELQPPLKFQHISSTLESSRLVTFKPFMKIIALSCSMPFSQARETLNAKEHAHSTVEFHTDAKLLVCRICQNCCNQGCTLQDSLLDIATHCICNILRKVIEVQTPHHSRDILVLEVHQTLNRIIHVHSSHEDSHRHTASVHWHVFQMQITRERLPLLHIWSEHNTQAKICTTRTAQRFQLSCIGLIHQFS